MSVFRGARPIDQFSAFHTWLDQYMRALGTAPEGSPALSPAQAPAQPPAQAPAQLPGVVRAAVVARIDSLAGTGRAGVWSGAAADNAHEIRYLMAAFADEILITGAWPHRAEWLDWLVEEAMFGSRRAGDRVFERIEALLGSGDALRRDMALPYLFALALGFRGCAASGADGDELLARTRQRLFQLARERDPDPAFGAAADALDASAARRTMARPYQVVASAGLPVMLPSPYRWRSGFVLAFALLLASSWVIWHEGTRELREHLEGKTSAARLVQPQAERRS